MTWTIMNEDLQKEIGGGGDYIFPAGTFLGTLVAPTFGDETNRVRTQTLEDLQALLSQGRNLGWMFEERNGSAYCTGDLESVNLRLQPTQTLETPEGGRPATENERFDFDLVITANGTSISDITPGEINGEGSAMHGNNAKTYGQLAAALGVGETTSEGFTPAPNFPQLLREGAFEGTTPVVFEVKHRTNRKTNKTRAFIAKVQPAS